MERSPTSETRVLRLFGDVEEETKGEASDRSPLETEDADDETEDCLLYTSPSPRDKRQSRMPSSA